MGMDEESSGKSAVEPDSMAEFMVAADAMSAGMTELVASAIRMQMLMLEDAQNMMAELSAVCSAAAEVGPDVEEEE